MSYSNIEETGLVYGGSTYVNKNTQLIIKIRQAVGKLPGMLRRQGHF